MPLVATRVATRLLAARLTELVSVKLTVTASAGSMTPLAQLSAASVDAAMEIAGVVATKILKTPRPCVAATRYCPIQNSSSTDTFAGPSLAGDQLAPPVAE